MFERAYISPIVNPKNEGFTASQISAMTTFARKCSGVRVACFGDWRIPRRSKVLVLNWFEERVATSSVPALAFAISVLTLCWLKLRVKYIVWIRHNHVPHGVPSNGARLHKVYLQIIGKLTTTVVTMRPLAELPSHVVPHCQYESNKPFNSSRDIQFLIFGRIRRYKNIPFVLQSWPASLPLYIAGECHDLELSRQIASVISQRGLNVRWEDRYLTSDEVENLLGRAKYVLIAHEDRSMIVSGSFYHAASRGANVIVTKSDFGDFAASTYTFVHTIHTSDDVSRIQRYIPPLKVLEELAHRNGPDVICRAWTKVFRSIGVSGA